MKTTISPRDLELLSAYLDGQLDRRNQMKVEKRLDREPALNEVLVDLERTRTLLRSAGPIKAPRSFKLKPEMVAQPRRRPVYPIFQFAAAVAVALLLIVVIGDFRQSRLMTTAYAPAPEVQAPMASGVQERSSEDMAQKNSATEQPAQGFMMAAPAATSTSPAAADAYPGPTGEPAAGAAPMMSSLAITESQTVSSSQTLSTTIAMATGEPAGTLPDQPAPGAQTPAETTTSPVNWYRIAEVGLVSLAVLLAAISILLRRRA